MAYLRCTGAPGGSLKLRTAQGEIASFETNIVDLLKEVKCSINPIQSGSGTPYPAGGGKNKFDYTQATGGTFNNNNGTFTNNTTDTRTTFYLTIQAYNGSTLIDTIGSKTISSTGLAFCTFTFPSGANTLRFKHNGSQQDLVIYYPFTTEGEFTLSFDVLGYNPSVMGGLSFKNVQIEAGSVATDYAPYSNIRPINGYSSANITRRGVNLWDEEWENGSIGTGGVNVSDSTKVRSTNYIMVKPNTTFYIKSPNMMYIWEYDVNKNCVVDSPTGKTNATFTTGANTVYIRFRMDGAYGTTYNNDISINYPATDTSYHAYNGNTYVIAFGQTVYGGQLIILPDRTYFHVTHAKYVGTWGDGGSEYLPPQAPSVKRRTFTLNPQAPTSSVPNNGHSLCNVTDTYSTANNLDSSHYYVADNLYLYLPIATSDDTAIECSYVIKEPFDIDLTPVQIEALLGVNNVWHDANGDTEVKYLYNA